MVHVRTWILLPYRKIRAEGLVHVSPSAISNFTWRSLGPLTFRIKALVTPSCSALLHAVLTFIRRQIGFLEFLREFLQAMHGIVPHFSRSPEPLLKLHFLLRVGLETNFAGAQEWVLCIWVSCEGGNASRDQCWEERDGGAGLGGVHGVALGGILGTRLGSTTLSVLWPST